MAGLDERGADVDTAGRLDVAQRPPVLVGVRRIAHERQRLVSDQRRQGGGRFVGPALVALGRVDPDQRTVSAPSGPATSIVSPSITDVTVQAVATGAAIVVGSAVVVGAAGGSVVDVAVVVVAGDAVVVELDGIVVVTSTVVGDCVSGVDVSAAVASGADGWSRSATAAPLPDPSPPASAPPTPTRVIAMPAHAQKGSRRQRRFHHGAAAGSSGRGASGRSWATGDAGTAVNGGPLISDDRQRTRARRPEIR